MEEPKGRERRQKVRIPFVYGIEFDDVEDTAVLSGSSAVERDTRISLKDISSDGLQVASPKFIAEGVEVRILLKFPRWRGVPKDIIVEETGCVVHAKVQWVAKNQSDKSFRIGLMFTKVSIEAREIINRYLEENIIIEDEEEDLLK